ncbi:TIGR04283 family arsenosugar biosynthesis glycosyltransferase [Crocinitomix catalasitica]|uniref:TIGR04283 family arsenosugar biosynthesis glycosyltransferase n=1 Tax=Crocinitomix catalasitica TaxID=184607 RepID=UPI000480CB1B|nr:TIGR04283 family arsenosugar biosynthesis glycosyltransferase [Crocinitomix catalasitica]
MKLSIIIPTLNEASSIGRLIKRLLTAPSEALEIIVVDGGSKDDTLKILAELPVQVIHSKACRAVQLIDGIAQATNEYLYLVHADTLPPLTYYEDGITALQKNKAATYRSQFEQGPFMLKLNAFFTRFNWLISRGGDQSLFIHKKTYYDLGGYNEDCKIMEEYPLLEKLMQNKYLIVIPKTILISTRKYNGRSWLKVSRANYFAFKMYGKGEPTEAIRAKYLELLGE